MEKWQEREATAGDRWLVGEACHDARPSLGQRVQSFLAKIYAQSKDSKNEAVINIIFDEIDDRLMSGDLRFCDSLLRKADPQRLSVDAMLAILSITSQATPHLNFRARFAAEVEEALMRVRTEAEVAALLRGLK
jgi:hypothetical protein